MSSREQVEAERAIFDVLFMLNCVSYTEQHVAEVDRAIDLYVAGDFKSAAHLSTAMLKRRAAKRLNGEAAAEARSLGDLEQAFRASTKRTRIEVDQGSAFSMKRLA